MAWTGEKTELTPGQAAAAKFAGIPADRAGLGAEYPKAVYKEDTGGEDRRLLGEPILVRGQFAVKTATVNDEIEEIEALEQGWFLSPDLKEEIAKRTALQEKDDEIARLTAELAAKGRRKPEAADDI